MQTQTRAEVAVARAVPALEGLRRLGVATAAGALAGFAVGGVGGRLAMLVLRLTSSPSLHGLETDDGFTIGSVSGATMFLLVATTVLGAVGGATYLAIRSWLPRRTRPWVVAALGGAIGGAAIIRPDGIDFTVLDPLVLAVVTFIAIPAVGMGATSLLIERLLADGRPASGRTRRMFGLVPFVPVLLLGWPGLLVGASALLVAAVGWRSPELGELWGSRPVVALGRVLLAAVFALAASALVRDVLDVL